MYICLITKFFNVCSKNLSNNKHLFRTSFEWRFRNEKHFIKILAMLKIVVCFGALVESLYKNEFMLISPNKDRLFDNPFFTNAPVS